MAELVSPGVSVSITDESFYAAAGTGTVPLIMIATAQDKSAPDGSGTAAFTSKAEAGEVKLITSQRELLTNFGNPTFQTVGSNASHGDELNEYGLFAAYSFLGIANRAFVVRADIDLAALQPKAVEPAGAAEAGSYWVDTADTVWGLKRYDGDKWTRQTVLVTGATDVDGASVPLSSFGNTGDFAVVYFDDTGSTESEIFFYEKFDAANWQVIGSTSWATAKTAEQSVDQDFQILNSTQMPPATQSDGGTLQVGDIILQMNTANNGTSLDLSVYVNGQWVAVDDYHAQHSYQAHAWFTANGGLSEGDIWVDYNNDTVTYAGVEFKRWNGGTSVTATGSVVQNTDITDTSVDYGNAQVDYTFGIVVNDNDVVNGTDGIIKVDLSRDDPSGNPYWTVVTTDAGDAVSASDISADASANTITTAGAVDFSVFTAGRTVTITGSANINGTYTVVSSNSTTIEIDPGVLALPSDETAGAAISIQENSLTVNGFEPVDIVRAIQHSISAENDALTDGDDLTVSQSAGAISIVSASGYDIRIVGGVGGDSTVTEANLGFLTTAYSNWEDLSFTSSPNALTGDPVDGQLWYDYRIDEEAVDLLVNDSGTDNWISYPGTVQIAASEPDTTLYAEGDIWIDSGDLENYPSMYKLSASNVWVAIDTTDQESEDGIVFGDARVDSSAALDADAPDADLYPYGILLWNLRGSGGNVKEYKKNYTVNGELIGDRWVDKGGNNVDGSAALLRKAQRKVVVKALSAAINSSEELRNESNRFNLIATPGYPELLDEMNALNNDRKLTAFIIGDTPLRLKADGTSLQNWATNANESAETNDNGLVNPGGEQSAYMAVYYPHGLTTNLDGSNVVVPSSHIILRTMAFNDQVAYPWFAPAGFQRGVVTNAASVGYIDADSSNEFVAVSLSEGQRDTLYANKVNPIGNFPGRGLAVFGQKTLYPNASALDRVNVGRLVVYIRERLDDIVKPFLFEPNDEITRQNAKVVVDRFLGNLVSQRGLYDFLTVVDTTNNTPARIDRNELYIDVAIQPVKAIEFIYIPVRVQNTLGSTG